ncbi:alanine--tRNA ligase [Candidatus Saganbacteria bacterium]|nr:alanine--tRNA ligase [Candidatus Saganbacteria bacterium]
MKSDEIRKTFLKYFESKGHKILPSSSLIPKDPTVLLTLAGMLQFKPIFLGIEEPQHKKVATVQKCIRMNDLENVGKTSRHHTFFEMLGNFSFGDYFKTEAIEMAWELLTKVYGLPADRLVAAVYEKDDEAAEIWAKKIKLPIDRIYRLDEENNFWSAGPTGPCGPCSEIYYDYGTPCGRPNCNPACDCERFLEVWNLVFIEFDRQESGHLVPLPKKNIDTGMGLERIARLLQNVETNFDTDLFAPILKELPDPQNLPARVVADHVRAATYLLADGLRPGNEGRGYVLRRIIRRAVLFLKKLKLTEAYLSKLAEIVILINQAAYPELGRERKNILSILNYEEKAFSATLESGLKLLDKYRGAKILPGEEAFKLHDTYGFPIELTRELMAVDEAGFAKCMEEQRGRARQAGSFREKFDAAQLKNLGRTNFIGYDKFEAEAKITGMVPEENIVVLDKSPFYPEGGGQVGDTGILGENLVQDTYGEIGGLIGHKLDHADNLKVGQKVKVKIDLSKRAATSAHHTSTHLLQAALRRVLGPEVKQSGSLVAPDRLRFDYTSTRALTPAEIGQVEKIVNDSIKAALPVEIFETTMEEARKLGVLAFFEEKYGEKVRVVKIDEVSRELCGGCHVKNTKEIAFFKIVKEDALQAGVRRIEATAGSAAKVSTVFRGKNLKLTIDGLMQKHRLLQAQAGKQLEADIFEIDVEEIERLKRAVDAQDIENVNKFLEHLEGRREWLRDRNLTLEKEIGKLKEKQALERADDIAKDIKEIKGVRVLAVELAGFNIDNLRSLSDSLRQKIGSGILLLAGTAEGKVSFLVSVPDELTSKYHAGKLAKILAETCGGGGGGKANKAEAGGKDPSKVGEAFNQAIGSL